MYALDTEFHRERTYFPQVALIQIAWPGGGLAVIDPLAVDVVPLATVIDSDRLAVMHAAAQDLEVLDRCCGVVPNRLFDTQLAAGFLGLSNPSLAALHERELGVRLPKANRLTDWLERPLTSAQLDYAASDVAYLLEVHDRVIEQLDARGRVSWAEGECAQLLARSREGRDPSEAWRRIKEVRHLRGKAHDVARTVAAWREERAAETDQPVRFVLPDLAVVAIAQKPAKNRDALRKIRGLDDRHLRNGAAESLLAAVARGLDDPIPMVQLPRKTEPSRELRPAVTLVSAWVSQLSNELEIDPALLGTRAEIEAYVRGDEDAKMADGWRRELVGDAIDELVEGRAGLAFDGDAGLRLVPVRES